MSDLVRGIEREPATAESLPTLAEAPETLFGDLYALLIEIRELARVRGPVSVPWARLEAMVDRLAASLRASADLFWLVNDPSLPLSVDWVAYHQARVAVLALRLGATLRYDRARLRVLGMAACLMDIALWRMPHALICRMDALTGEEAATYQAHPWRSAEMVRRWAPPNERIVTAIVDHHEREHGHGFPRRLESASIDPNAKMLGLVDTYTALMLPPSSRPRLRPHEVIREIVKSRQDACPPALIKALLTEISVFPPGTVVRLNTNEIGRVVAVNRSHPLRPRVEILTDGSGYRVIPQRTIDLAEAPFLYITGPVTEATVA